MRYLTILFFALTLIIGVFGQRDGNPVNWCRNGAFPRENSTYQLATIIGKQGKKVFFYGDKREDCPNGKNCRLKSYVIAGDEIIVSRAFGGYVCAWFQPKKGAETVGWIKTNNLKWVKTNENPELKDWLGDWRFYDNSMLISTGKTSNLLTIKGNAFWKGIGDNIHVGELNHSAKPVGNQLNLGENDMGEYDCKVSIQLVGKYLIASDNLNCGGANVTFSGVYRKK